jgi:hypothetical protein
LTAISSEPLRLNPALLPDNVPPLLVKSTELSANAIIGRAKASRTIHNIRFIKLPPEVFAYFSFNFDKGQMP